MKLLWWGVRCVLVLLVIIGLLAGGLVLWVRHYVQTPEFAKDVKRAGQQVAGADFDFDHLQWDIGRGLTVENVHLLRASAQEDAEPAAQMQAWQIILKYDWASLWHRQFEITRLTFKSPRFIIRQQDNGEFLLPFAPPQQSVSLPDSPIEPKLNAFNLDSGDLRVLRRDRTPLLEIINLQAEGQRPEEANGNPALSGVMNVARTIFWGRINLLALQSPFRYQDYQLKLTSLQGDFYGGRLSGQWEQHLAHDDLPYGATLDVHGIDMAKLLADAADMPNALTGKLNVKTSWLGPGKRPADVAGEGSFELLQGRVLDIPFFRDLAAQLPGLQVIAQPDFEVISGEYTLAGQQVKFSNLRMKSTLFEISGAGTVGFDQKLNARLRLAINPRLVSRLPAEATSLMTSRQPDQYKTFDVAVTGSLGQPRLSIPVSDAMRQRAWENLRQYLGPMFDKAGADNP